MTFPYEQEKKEGREDSVSGGNALVDTANSEQYLRMHYFWIGRKGGGNSTTGL